MYQEGRAGQRARPGRGGRGETCSLQSRLLPSAAPQGASRPAVPCPQGPQYDAERVRHLWPQPLSTTCRLLSPEPSVRSGFGGQGQAWLFLEEARLVLATAPRSKQSLSPAGPHAGLTGGPCWIYSHLCCARGRGAEGSQTPGAPGAPNPGLLEGGQGYLSLAGDRQTWLCVLGARVDWGLRGLLPLPPGPSQPALRAVWGRRGLCRRTQGPLLPTAAADRHCPGPAPGWGPERACASPAHTRLFLATSSPGVHRWGLSVGRPLGLETSGEGEEAGL